MPRSLRDRWREDPWKQTGEALGHAVVMMASMGILAGFMAWDFAGCEAVGGALAAIPLVILREGIDQWPIHSWGDTALDSLEFVAGGALGGLFVGMVR